MPRFGFTYIFCNDLAAMKAFYTDTLQLEQVWEDERSLVYRIGDHQLSITLAEGLPTPPAEFSLQPGWRGGTAPRTSWSLECEKQEFDRLVAAAKDASVRSWSESPEWVGYWSFPLLDPMNNTVEITCPER